MDNYQESKCISLEIPIRPCRDSDAGIGYYLTINYHEHWIKTDGKYVLGLYWGKYLLEVSTKGIHFWSIFATGLGG